MAAPTAPRTPRVIVVGLGPADVDLVTVGTMRRLEQHEHRFVRTRRHPAASLLDGAPSFDHLYDESDTLDEVYVRIVDELVVAAERWGEVLYAVPGSPVVAEHTVELLLADERVDVQIEPALSFVDLAWVRLGIDPIAGGARIIDGHRFEVEAAGERGPLLVAQCDSVDVLSGVKLAIAEALETRSTLGSGLARRPADAGSDQHERGVGLLPDDLRITVVQRLGLPDERVVDIAWHELDRVVEPDHLTSLWIPSYAAPVAMEVQRFAELVATLRRECPWDREQTHESLRRHLLEESYEVLDALDHVDVEGGEGYEHLEEELGDLLFQILFHATLASEAGQFTMADVARTVHDKLYSRHPHVFGRVDADDADQVAANWEQIKKDEKGRASVFDGIPDALPALLLALKIQKKAGALELGSTAGDGVPGTAALGAVWIADLDELVARARAGGGADVIGELLFATVDLARRADVDPETALRAVAIAHRDAAQALEP
jgi:tetrapyrrole methylase family protein/MazG family protein